MGQIHIRFTIFLALLILVIRSDFSLEEYEQLQKQTPEVVFDIRTNRDEKQYTPNLQKIIFTTPWNKQGSELVIKYAQKFDYVSPCWFDLTFKKDMILIQSDQNFNKTFIEKVKQVNPNIKIVPRIYIAGNQHALLQHIGSVESKLKQAVLLITTIINKDLIDGMVWDTPFNLLLRNQKQMPVNNLIVQLVNSIRLNLNQGKLIFYNMGNPMSHVLSQSLYQMLQVDAFLIQNYDAGNDYPLMIRSSVHWAKTARLSGKPKFFLLLPFFSRRQGQGISTSQVYRALENQGVGKTQIAYENAGMCVFQESTTRATSHVPCYAFFKECFIKIGQANLGVGFWEAGNGLENYYLFL